MPKVGPNYKIISAYQQQYVDALKISRNYYEGEPIIVERTHPEGYRIVNGHHRWAAALRIGMAQIPSGSSISRTRRTSERSSPIPGIKSARPSTSTR